MSDVSWLVLNPTPEQRLALMLLVIFTFRMSGAWLRTRLVHDDADDF